MKGKDNLINLSANGKMSKLISNKQEWTGFLWYMADSGKGINFRVPQMVQKYLAYPNYVLP